MFDAAYIAPDVALDTSELTYPPSFGTGPDGTLSIFLRGADEEAAFSGQVTQVHRAGALALVEVSDTTVEPLTDAPPLRIVYLVSAATLPKPTPLHLVSRIGALCRERGITAKELAARASFSVSTARRLMRGEVRTIKATHLERVCGVLDVSIGEILVLAPDAESR